MTKEEIFKTLEKACILDKNCEEVDCLLEEDLIAIRELISLYKKQQKEIEKFNNILNEYVQDEDFNWKQISDYVEEYYISKYKIKDKIKELEEKDLYFEKQIIQGRIDLLKELLED